MLADRDARVGLLDEVDLQSGLYFGQAFRSAPGEQDRADGVMQLPLPSVTRCWNKRKSGGLALESPFSGLFLSRAFIPYSLSSVPSGLMSCS